MALSAIQVGTTRLWKRSWPLKWGSEFPNRLLARATKMGLLRPIWFEFRPGLWMKCDWRELVQETLLSEGIWEPKTTDYLCSALLPAQVFVDIGANVGYFTLLAARCVGPLGKVLAVEPNPAMTEQLRQNIARSGLTNVVAEVVACSASTGVCRLYTGGPYNTGRSSLCSRNLQWTASVDVNCVPADILAEKHALPRIDLVKIDVEGAELEVLRGMRDILKHWRPKIVIELLPSLLEGFSTTFNEVLEYMAGLGYSIRPLGEHSNYLFYPS